MRRDDATPSLHPHLSLAPGATQRAQGASITHLHHPSHHQDDARAADGAVAMLGRAPSPRW